MCYFCTAALEEYRPNKIKIVWIDMNRPSRRSYTRIKHNACARLFIHRKSSRLIVHPKTDKSKEFWTYIDKDYIDNLTLADTDKKCSSRLFCLSCVD